MTPNQLNFSGGPGALPDEVLTQLSEAMLSVPGVGLSVLGISHRSDWFRDIVNSTAENIRSLYDISDEYHVLFQQGGATQQFYSLPRMLARDGVGAYIESGYWSKKAIKEATYSGVTIDKIWSGDPEFNTLPNLTDLSIRPDAKFLHFCSNETVEGVQFQSVPSTCVPVVCDMSSDFLSRRFDVSAMDFVYAHAQKNLGPSGVTIVLLKDSLLSKMDFDGVPPFLDYREQIKANSIYNTPPVFAIYAVYLATEWIKSIGGLTSLELINRRKSVTIYDVIDNSSLFIGHAKSHRSITNVSMKFEDDAMTNIFLEASARAGFSGLNGHRSLGGLRASLYNGLTVDAAEQLAQFMIEFERTH